MQFVIAPHLLKLDMWEKTSSQSLPNCFKMPTTQWIKHSKVGRWTKFKSSAVAHVKVIPYVIFPFLLTSRNTNINHKASTLFSKTKKCVNSNIESKMDKLHLIGL